jgi:putative FmdB family regulatory protein
MPTYDYKCKSCHHGFELRKSFHEEPTASCPICGEEARRLFALVPVVFKGSGFYVTDHRDAEKSTTVEAPKAVGTNSTSEQKLSSEAPKSTAPVVKKEAASSNKTQPN